MVPVLLSGFFLFRGVLSLDPRIDQGVSQVGEQHDQGEGQGDEHDAAGDHCGIAVVDAVHQQLADAGDREDHLNHRGAAQHPAEPHADQGKQEGHPDGVQHRVRQLTIPEDGGIRLEIQIERRLSPRQKLSHADREGGLQAARHR